MKEHRISLTEQDLKQAIYLWLQPMPLSYRPQSPYSFEIVWGTSPPGKFEGRNPIVCTVIETREE